jgi:hypothetical protein
VGLNAGSDAMGEDYAHADYRIEIDGNRLTLLATLVYLYVLTLDRRRELRAIEKKSTIEYKGGEKPTSSGHRSRKTSTDAEPEPVPRVHPGMQEAAQANQQQQQAAWQQYYPTEPVATAPVHDNVRVVAWTVETIMLKREDGDEAREVAAMFANLVDRLKDDANYPGFSARFQHVIETVLYSEACVRENGFRGYTLGGGYRYRDPTDIPLNMQDIDANTLTPTLGPMADRMLQRIARRARLGCVGDKEDETIDRGVRVWKEVDGLAELRFHPYAALHDDRQNRTTIHFGHLRVWWDSVYKHVATELRRLYESFATLEKEISTVGTPEWVALHGQDLFNAFRAVNDVETRCRRANDALMDDVAVLSTRVENGKRVFTFAEDRPHRTWVSSWKLAKLDGTYLAAEAAFNTLKSAKPRAVDILQEWLDKHNLQLANPNDKKVVDIRRVINDFFEVANGDGYPKSLEGAMLEGHLQDVLIRLTKLTPAPLDQVDSICATLWTTLHVEGYRNVRQARAAASVAYVTQFKAEEAAAEARGGRTVPRANWLLERLQEVLYEMEEVHHVRGIAIQRVEELMKQTAAKCDVQIGKTKPYEEIINNAHALGDVLRALLDGVKLPEYTMDHRVLVRKRRRSRCDPGRFRDPVVEDYAWWDYCYGKFVGLFHESDGIDTALGKGVASELLGKIKKAMHEILAREIVDDDGMKLLRKCILKANLPEVQTVLTRPLSQPGLQHFQAIDAWYRLARENLAIRDARDDDSDYRSILFKVPNIVLLMRSDRNPVVRIGDRMVDVVVRPRTNNPMDEPYNLGMLTLNSFTVAEYYDPETGDKNPVIDGVPYVLGEERYESQGIWWTKTAFVPLVQQPDGSFRHPDFFGGWRHPHASEALHGPAASEPVVQHAIQLISMAQTMPFPHVQTTPWGEFE